MIEDFFPKVIEYGRLVRSKKLDGLKSWNDIKGLFNDQVTCPEWHIVRIIGYSNQTDIQNIYDYVYNELGMDGDDSVDKTDHDLWSKKHFFLQLNPFTKKWDSIISLVFVKTFYVY